MYTFETNIAYQKHDAFVEQHPLCNLLQSANWGLVKENWRRDIVGVSEQGSLVASAMLLIKPLPLGFSMIYIPRGPVMDYENKALVEFTLTHIRKYAKKYHALFITFDPAIHCNDYYLEDANEEHHSNIPQVLSTLTSCGAVFKGFSKDLSSTIQPRYHANVYRVHDFEAQQLKALKKALTTVQKKKIHVNAYHTDGVERFAKVMHCTEERKNIQLRDADYFHKLMEIYGEDAVIYLAELPLKVLYEETKVRYEQNVKELEACPENAKKKRFTLEELHASLTREVRELEENCQRDGDVAIISGALCVKFGSTAEILYAGMDDRYKRYMAPYASFYQCMLWSFEKGCTWCNMGGIEGDLKGGLTKFKANYHPMINEFIGEFDLPVMRIFYGLSQWAMKQRKKLLHKK